MIEVNNRFKAYKKKAMDLLTSEEGIRHRSRRCIEPESVFGQIKSNMGYRRFRHFEKDKITMDFSFFATAFNIRKLCKMLLNGSLKHLQRLIKLLLERILLEIGFRLSTSCIATSQGSSAIQRFLF